MIFTQFSTAITFELQQFVWNLKNLKLRWLSDVLTRFGTVCCDWLGEQGVSFWEIFMWAWRKSSKLDH